MPPSICVRERVPKASEIVAKEMDQKAKGKAEKKIATWKDLIKLNVGGQNGLKEEAVPAVRKEMSKKQSLQIFEGLQVTAEQIAKVTGARKPLMQPKNIHRLGHQGPQSDGLDFLGGQQQHFMEAMMRMLQDRQPDAIPRQQHSNVPPSIFNQIRRQEPYQLIVDTTAVNNLVEMGFP